MNTEIILSKDWTNFIKKVSSTKKKCFRCGVDYLESENIGSWRCLQHISRVHSSSRSKWDCCSMPITDSKRLSTCGCIPCDHSSDNYDFTPLTDSYIIPKMIAQQLGIILSSKSVINVSRDNVKILRCDPDIYNEKYSKVLVAQTPIKFSFLE